MTKILFYKTQAIWQRPLRSERDSSRPEGVSMTHGLEQPSISHLHNKRELHNFAVNKAVFAGTGVQKSPVSPSMILTRLNLNFLTTSFLGYI